MKILVLGGGQQGKVIAGDLAAALPGHAVTVADVARRALPAHANLAFLEADLSDAGVLARLLGGHDLAVGALPSRLGFGVMRAAIAARRNLVDVSFSAEDPLTLDAEARAAGVTIVPDAGLAPGLSHLLVGRAARERGRLRAATILVGGVAEDPSRPYGYTITWSLDDLMEEYVRPARIRRRGRDESVPVFSELERVHIAGAGEMEAFYSDGLRTLLQTMPDIPDLGEKTLRWPGHVAAIRPLLRDGRLREELRARCSDDPPRDLVAMMVRTEWDGGVDEATLVDRYEPRTRLTAMARTTALTTAAVARLAVAGGLGAPGVRPLETIAGDERADRFVTDILAGHGIRIARRQAAREAR